MPSIALLDLYFRLRPPSFRVRHISYFRLGPPSFLLAKILSHGSACEYTNVQIFLQIMIILCVFLHSRVSKPPVLSVGRPAGVGGVWVGVFYSVAAHHVGLTTHANATC